MYTVLHLHHSVSIPSLCYQIVTLWSWSATSTATILVGAILVVMKTDRHSSHGRNHLTFNYFTIERSLQFSLCNVERNHQSWPCISSCKGGPGPAIAPEECHRAFPAHSHRPSVIAPHNLFHSLPKPVLRWNFRKVNWNLFYRLTWGRSDSIRVSLHWGSDERAIERLALFVSAWHIVLATAMWDSLVVRG